MAQNVFREVAVTNLRKTVAVNVAVEILVEVTPRQVFLFLS